MFATADAPAHHIRERGETVGVISAVGVAATRRRWNEFVYLAVTGSPGLL